MRIGITMRRVENATYPESRDALSSEWAQYITRVLPEATLIPLLNNKKNIARCLVDMSFTGIILSNGNDLGEAPERDATEQVILAYCIEYNIPVFGVCRGFQFINSYLGGQVITLKEHNIEGHVGKQHPVGLISHQRLGAQPSEINVNSFHNLGVTLEGLSQDLEAFAVAEGRVVEGFVHAQKPIVAIQWHPERYQEPRDFDTSLLQALFH